MEETLVSTSRTCLNCGEDVGPGRKDKKYCSEACKTEYNNKRTEQERQAQKQVQELSLPDFIGKIQNILIRNREILDRCLGDQDSRRLEKRDLEGLGFNFKYITSQAPTLEDKGYCFCYELGYREVGNDRVIIVRREREVSC